MLGRMLPEEVPALRAPTTRAPLSVELEVVTPMAGHTATKTGKADVGDHAREASAANLLRNWWRIAHCGNYGSSEAVFAAEQHLFGSASAKGLVRVVTTTIDAGKEHSVGATLRRGRLVRDWPDHWPQYALFPWQRVENEGDLVFFRCGMKFRVDVTAPEDRLEELRTALAAWVHLGGLGQRTRRGLGSLRQTSGTRLPTLHQVVSTHTCPVSQMTGLPKPADTLTLYGGGFEAITAWQEAVGAYHHFRQGVGPARERSTRPRVPAGRSKYPEADSIRQLVGGHADATVGFPRADLGLPIIFEFKGSGDWPPTSEVTLGGEGRSRFASPVISKAWWDGKSFQPLVAVLASPPVWASNSVEWKSRPGIAHGRPVSQGEIALTPTAREQIWGTDEGIRDAFLALCECDAYEPVRER